MITTLYKKSRGFVEHHWLTVAFLLGFVIDNITLNRVDQLFDNFILLSYIVLAMVSIALLYAGIAERFSEPVNHFLKSKMPFVMQYAFGGLLSGMLIFYGRSSSLADSWLFLLLILGVIFGNETIKNRSQRLVYNLVIFFVGLFAYVILIVPVVLGKMGPLIFVGSGLLALSVMYLFFSFLERIVPNFIELQKRNVVFIVGLIYVTLHALYFMNVIPPIPLSLKSVGIYHNVEKLADGAYLVSYEKPRWWEWYRTSDHEYHYSTGEDIFCYASVFAPSRLSTDIYHRWEYYDEAEGAWIEHGRYSYSIQGGRGDGYRGFTKISNYREGEWRCIVETARGQIIGKEKFTVTSGVKGELISEVQ